MYNVIVSGQRLTSKHTFLFSVNYQMSCVFYAYKVWITIKYQLTEKG